MVNSEFFTNMRHMILLVCHRSNKINEILTYCALTVLMYQVAGGRLKCDSPGIAQGKKYPCYHGTNNYNPI